MQDVFMFFIRFLFLLCTLVLCTVQTAVADFQVNADGTVTDTTTRLMWTLEEDQNLSGGRTWKEALAYCESCTTAGYSDWRLPNVRELESLVDWNRSSPSIDPVFAECLASNYWSSSSDVPDPGEAWAVFFKDGDVYPYGKNTLYYVRCVRNVPPPADGDLAPLGNRDGLVIVADALVCMRFALKLDTPTQEDVRHGDVAPLDANNQPDPDGRINLGDALVILRKALGIIAF